MDKTRRAEIRVGIVSILGLIVLVGGIFLGKGINVDPAAQQLRIRLPHSGGLESGAPVVVNGVKRGSVVGVDNVDDSVVVTVNVNDINDIHPDASAIVTILEITGGKKVEILPGTAPGQFDPKNEIHGRVAADIGGLITQVGDVSGDLVRLLRRLDTISAAVTELMADGTFATNVKSMAADGAVLIGDAKNWMQTNRENLTVSIRDMRETISDLKAAVKNNEPKLSRVLDKAEKSLADLEGTIAKADKAIVNVDTLITNVNSIVTDVKTNEGLANAILYDSTFKRRVDTLAATLRRFVNSARQNGVNVNVGIGHK